MNPTLEEYLADNCRRGVIDFAIRADNTTGKVTFYIHPTNVSGDTLDFAVKGNNLTPAGWAHCALTPDYCPSKPV